jgi:hypothetical protein
MAEAMSRRSTASAAAAAPRAAAKAVAIRFAPSVRASLLPNTTATPSIKTA